MNPKIMIDALPSNGKSFKIWFWLSIICLVISVCLYIPLVLEMYFKLAFELEESVHGNSILWGIPLAIPISIFGLILAKSFRCISDTLYRLTLTFAIMPLIQAFLDVLYCMWDIDVIAYMTFFICIINICLYIAISISIYGNYGGLFQEFGMGLWTAPVYSVILIAFMTLLNGLLHFDGFVKTIFGLGVDIYCIKICISKILKPLYTLLNNGCKERLTYTEMAEYIREEENRLEINREHNYHSDKYLNNSIYNQTISAEPLDSDADDWVSLRKKNRKYWYIGAVCIGVIALGFGIYKLVSNNSDSYKSEQYTSEVANDNKNYEESDYNNQTDENREISVESTTEPYSLNIPDWLDYLVLETFDKTDLSEKPYDWLKDNVLRHSYASLFESEKYHGKMGTYPVTVEMKIDKDGTVSGRYAYDSTLKKYGDNPLSWFRIRGSVLFDEENYPYIVMETYHPDTGEVYEYALLKYNAPDNWEGRLMNKKYINSNLSKFYSLYFNL